MNESVEMTINQFQQNISVELTDDFCDRNSTGKFIKYPVNIAEF